MKLNKKLQFGRQYQLGQLEGNFLYVGECTSIRMTDAASLKEMIHEHQQLFSVDVQPIATDRVYYSLNNEQLLQRMIVKEIGLQQPCRVLNHPPSFLSPEAEEKLYNRQAVSKR